MRDGQEDDEEKKIKPFPYWNKFSDCVPPQEGMYIVAGYYSFRDGSKAFRRTYAYWRLNGRGYNKKTYGWKSRQNMKKEMIKFWMCMPDLPQLLTQM